MQKKSKSKKNISRRGNEWCQELFSSALFLSPNMAKTNSKKVFTKIYLISPSIKTTHVWFFQASPSLTYNFEENVLTVAEYFLPFLFRVFPKSIWTGEICRGPNNWEAKCCVATFFKVGGKKSINLWRIASRNCFIIKWRRKRREASIDLFLLLFF